VGVEVPVDWLVENENRSVQIVSTTNTIA
jgi:hypothetical protein